MEQNLVVAKMETTQSFLPLQFFVSSAILRKQERLFGSILFAKDITGQKHVELVIIMEIIIFSKVKFNRIYFLIVQEKEN